MKFSESVIGEKSIAACRVERGVMDGSAYPFARKHPKSFVE